MSRRQLVIATEESESSSNLIIIVVILSEIISNCNLTLVVNSKVGWCRRRPGNTEHYIIAVLRSCGTNCEDSTTCNILYY